MKKLIVLNVLLILAVLAATSTVTFAYFTNTRSEAVSFVTSRVGIDEVNNFPLQFSNLMPGEWQAQKVALRNTSSIPADLYLQMGANSATTMSFCAGPQGRILGLRIESVDANGASLADVYNNSICNLYPLDGSSSIALLAANVAPGEWRYFKFHVALNANVDNVYYMNGANKDTVHLIAVQRGAPHPQAVTGKLWPEGDPNY